MEKPDLGVAVAFTLLHSGNSDTDINKLLHFSLYFMFLVSLNADSSRDSNVFRKVGGRHGMVFGYVSPKAIHLPPLVPGTVLRLGLVCLLDVNEEEVDCCPSVLRDLSVH